MIAIVLVLEFSHARSAHASLDGIELAVVANRSQDRLAARLVAELNAVGLRSRTILRDQSALASATPREMAKSVGIRGGIDLALDARSARLWTIDRNDELWQALVDRQNGETPELFLLRSVELLRANLVEIAARPPGRGRLSIGLMGGTLLGPGGASPAMIAGAHVSYRLHRFFAIEGIALTAPYPARATDAASQRASLYPTTLGASALVPLFDPASHLFAAAGGGGALAILVSSGASTNPGLSRTETSLSALAFGRVAFGYRFTQHWEVRFDAIVGAMLARQLVIFDQVEIARYGQPLIALGLGVAYCR